MKEQSKEEQIGMVFSLVSHIWDNPEFIDETPNGATIKFVDTEEPKTIQEVKLPVTAKKVDSKKELV